MLLETFFRYAKETQAWTSTYVYQTVNHGDLNVLNDWNAEEKPIRNIEKTFCDLDVEKYSPKS